MTKRLELLFTDTLKGNVTIGLDDPIEPVDAAAISSAMDIIIAQGALTSAKGDLVAKRGARLVERNVQTIEIDV
ncbi:hypothetical protein CR203_06885 [Salipaludibacillus neizhouensis]|uniref:DUF2922 domain-containing protein n=1 Tax=Salipaludibacillus neizhouensis TaxID=885475 RepID=A0A3A9KUD4_9BACI|nr:DUF2922 domain-containing protein [Salipaludibacillus neizhouensis]RKL68206.1 hypothetical protein CR203_06885 [Salipaludibacillus neizhouensis]